MIGLFNISQEHKVIFDEKYLSVGPKIEALYSAYKNDVIQYKLPMIGQYTD